MVRGHIHLDPTGEKAQCIDRLDGRVDLLGRAGDHRLLRRGIHRHRDIRVLLTSFSASTAPNSSNAIAP